MPGAKASWRKTEPFRKKLATKAASLKLTKSRNTPTVRTDIVAAPLEVNQSASTEIEVAVKDTRVPMSVSEAQQRLTAMLIAAAEFAEHDRALKNARIVDDPKYVELRKYRAQLTSELAVDRTNRILELNLSASDMSARAKLMQIFGGGQIVNGFYVPLKVENVREALQPHIHHNSSEEE